MKSIGTTFQRAASGGSRLVFLTACLALLVAACGQRGPLYLPQKDAGGNAAKAESSQAEPAADGAESATEESEEEDRHEETP